MITAKIRIATALVGLALCGVLGPKAADAQCMGCLDDLGACLPEVHYDYPSGSAYEGYIIEAVCHWQPEVSCEDEHMYCFALRGLDLDAAQAVIRSPDARGLKALLSDSRFLVNVKTKALEVRSCDGTLAARFPLTPRQLTAARRWSVTRDRPVASTTKPQFGR